MIDRVGQQLGNYRVVRQLGRGGFAEVYLGEHIYLQSFAALKVLHTRLTDEQQHAFMQEARILSRFQHPHIVRLLDFSVQDGTPYLVMEYAPNGSLHDRHPKGTLLPPDLITSYVQQVASALQYAHDKGFIHRDVKPENMLLGSQDIVLLSDFGLATLMAYTHSGSTQHMEPSLRGTAPYLSPEQLQGHPNAASDQYALGVVVYEWLCGRLPFRGTVVEIAMQHLSASPPSLSEYVPGLAPAIEEVVLQALAKEPPQRFASVQDFATALERACRSAYNVQLPMPRQPGQIADANNRSSYAASSSSSFWNVPYRRNPFFTGREDVLRRVRNGFTGIHGIGFAETQALTGMGGIGKTQTAVEYSYRYRDAYRAIFWVRAANYETLVADFTAIARLLRLPEQDELDQNVVVSAVKQWMAQQPGWLLILDNVDDLSLVAEFLPAGSKGHILLTTRIQATGNIAHNHMIEKMEPGEGSLLLLRRAKLLSPDAPLEAIAPAVRKEAQTIVRSLDGLPLALEQAGAYIEETGCNLSEYLEFYQQRHKNLLERRSEVSPDYPHTVASVWSLAFQQVEQISSAAADLLRLCAFLDPDSIPEVLLIEGASELGKALKPVVTDAWSLREAVQVLRRFSLIRRDAEAKSLNIHRLVQVVLKDGMDEPAQRLWAERAIRAVNAAFPDVSVDNESRCQLCLPHALVCSGLIEQYQFTFPEASRLLNHIGWYLRERGQYAEAEPLLKRALAIHEQGDGADGADTAATLLLLGYLYTLQSRYSEAEQLLNRSLAIYEQTLGPEDTRTGETLNHLAWLHHLQGHEAQAESLFQRALTIAEQAYGPEDRNVAEVLSNLGNVYSEEGRFDEAEQVMQQAVTIYQHVLGPEHPETGLALNNLAMLFFYQGRYQKTALCFEQALTIQEQNLGPDHPQTALVCDNLGITYSKMGEFEKGENALRRALAIYERMLNPDTMIIAMVQIHLGQLYRDRSDYERAEPFFQHALAAHEKALGTQNVNTASVIRDLADLYTLQGRLEEAWPLFQRTLAIYEQSVAPDHIHMAKVLNGLARYYVERGQIEQAESLLQRALAIREKELGPEHPETGVTLDDLALLYWNQNRYERAEPLLQRALTIFETTFGPKHPRTIAARSHYADLLEQKQRVATLSSVAMPGVAPAQVSQKAFPARLTAREVEVLRMVAQGLTNIQIAEQLVLSEKTVINHLTHIFNKIGCDNRAAATAFAIRHGLA